MIVQTVHAIHHLPSPFTTGTQLLYSLTEDVRGTQLLYSLTEDVPGLLHSRPGEQ